ncbi:MAG: ABC transporter substrate-binding protein [Coriobacteriia bacterium]|nr:ABC transporter substrate-binding protein [Coriobacteriia bacterium]
MKLKKILSLGAKSIALLAILLLGLGALLACDSDDAGDTVVIATNADEEAVQIMRHVLDTNGFSGQYVVQELGTAELGGRLMAEGTSIEADLITLASFYLESSQAQNDTFIPLGIDAETMQDFPDYMAPILAITGSIFVNTELMDSDNLPTPSSIRDLADPVYEGNLAIADINSSTTAWLLTQALIDNYGEAEAEEILQGIYRNASDQVLPSGSGPIRAVRAGEVAIGFGLRHTAVADNAAGLPIDFIDPIEGNYQLVEALAVVDKGDNTNPLAEEMARVIIQHSRQDLQEYYPTALYVGESTDVAHRPADPRVFPQALTLELLLEHQAIVDRAARATN